MKVREDKASTQGGDFRTWGRSEAQVFPGQSEAGNQSKCSSLPGHFESWPPKQHPVEVFQVSFHVLTEDRGLF